MILSPLPTPRMTHEQADALVRIKSQNLLVSGYERADEPDAPLTIRTTRGYFIVAADGKILESRIGS